jgi:hypothetical protein
MKYLPTFLKSLAAVVLLAVAVGCASSTQEKQNLLVAAGFKVITPSKVEHQALLPKLPPGKVTQITYQGNTYYVMPDAANNQAYVGGPKQYQAYQQLRLAQQLSNQNLEAAQFNAAASMNWGAWGGWGTWGGYGWY